MGIRFTMTMPEKECTINEKSNFCGKDLDGILIVGFNREKKISHSYLTRIIENSSSIDSIIFLAHLEHIYDTIANDLQEEGLSTEEIEKMIDRVRTKNNL